jgi:hypothetical protein
MMAHTRRDCLEAFLHKDVCAKRSVELLWTYRRRMKENWLDLYHDIYGDN